MKKSIKEYQKKYRIKYFSNLLNEKRHRGVDKEYAVRKRKSGFVDRTQEYRDWREKNPIAYKAHKVFHTALKNGLIKRKSVCELKNKWCSVVIQAHHPDYNKPLEVIWLCASHHKKVDLGIINLNKPC